MSVRGGRGVRGLTTALALTILLLPIIPLAPAQSSADPWWGLSDRTRPTEGWAVRVPVTIENTFDHLLTDPFVAAEIDFAELLVKAGWTNQTIGAETRLRSFTLDVDSIRVVEYNKGFVTGPLVGPTTKPTPHRFYPALFESTKFREFHAERNPAGTVLWQISGDLKPQEKRYFYVFATPLEYGKTAPPVFDALERSPLDAFMWGSRGNVYLGFEPQQDGQSHFVEVRSSSTKTSTVTVSTYEIGRFTPIASTSTLPNPFPLTPGQPVVVKIPGNKPYRIESTHPITVFASGGGDAGAKWESFGYVPGRSGSFADDVFDVRGLSDDLGGFTTFRVIKASTGSVTISADCQGCPVRTLTNADPVNSLRVPAGSWSVVRGTGKFLISLDPIGQSESGSPPPKGFIPHQVPAITGGPSGTDFFSYLMDDNGYFRLCPEADTTLRVIDYSTGGNLQIWSPEGTLPNVAAARLAKGEMCTEVPVQKTITTTSTFEFYATKEERDPPPGSPVPFRLFVGAKDRKVDDQVNYTRPMIGHYGGLAGIDHYVDAPAGIFGHYNNTRLTLFEEKLRDGKLIVTNRTRSLQRDEYFPLVPSGVDSTGRFHIVATKPIAVSAIAPASYATCPPPVSGQQLSCVNNVIKYAQYIPGRPLLPRISIGAAEFRGPLVELRSAETESRQLFRSTGPGSPLTFRLDAVNLGRWIHGEGLPDTIVISCTTPTGWTVEGCAKEVSLTSGSAERLSVVVTPSADDVNATRTILVEAKSKAGGVAATFKLIVYVEVRYGVGMWFDVEGGRKTIDPPIGLDPAGIHRYNIIIKNTGSTTDTFDLAVEPPREGWEQELLRDDQPVTSVRLDGGESTTLVFKVKAPNAETAPQNIVSMTAQSRSSALAADVVNTATRIRPKVDLELTLEPQTLLAEPGELVKFDLTTRNKGNDVFTVLFRQDSILPKGWNATLSVDEITLNPNPGNDPALNFIMQVSVRPPPGARAGDLASVKLAAEIDTGGAGGRVAGDEVSAVVVVRRVYDLATPPVFDAEAEPGASLRFVLPVTNRGNGQVSLELLSGAVTPPWRVTLETEAVTLAINDTVDLPLRIDVPAGTLPGAYNLTFTTRLSREALQNLSIPVNVVALSRVEFVGATTLGLTPGRPVVLAMRAVNTGNVLGTFDFATSVPDGWAGTFAPERARLAPGESVAVQLQLNATRDATDGATIVQLTAKSSDAPPANTPLNIDVKRPQLSLASVTANGQLRAGELVLVSATVANAGGIEAENVSVALVVDGRVVDRVVVSRIPVGTQALATLSWISTQRGGDVKVVIDPDEEIALGDRSGAEQGVAFGSRLGVPATGLPALLLTLAALGWSLRRKERGDR